MPIIPAGSDATLADLRYPSVDDPRGRAVRRAASRVSGGTWAASVGAASVVAALAGALSGCARGEPATLAVPRAAAAEIRTVCPPGSFVAAMTVDCPQPLGRANER